MTLGCVILSRNDNYGGNLEERALLCFESAMNTFDEVIYVDWNSTGIDLIKQLGDRLPKRPNFKYYVITPEQHRQLTNNNPKAEMVCEVLARNIGIRRLTTDWIVATSIDHISPLRETLVGFAQDTFYTIAQRGIIIEEIQKLRLPMPDLQKVLHARMNEFQPVGPSGAYPGDKWSLINRCGGFQLAHKDIWYAIRGFEESLIHRGFMDSNVQKKAVLAGYKIVALNNIAPFHIDHSGVAQEIWNDCGRSLANFTQTTNPETWGFSNMTFEEHKLI